MNILITGATSGLGFDTGCRLLKCGHFVYFTCHFDEQVEVLENKLKKSGYFDHYQCFSLDITKASDRKKIYSLSIDCLFCHASSGLGGTLFDLGMSEIKNNFNTNVFSNLSLIQEYLKYSMENNHFAKVVLTTSIAGLMPVPFMDSYSATKASLISFATTLYYEQIIFSLPFSIKVIEPGIYETGFNQYMFSTAKENKFFSHQSFLEFLSSFFHVFSKKKYSSITKKMVRAIESDSKKFIYRAPFSQVLFLKLYLLFFK